MQGCSLIVACSDHLGQHRVPSSKMNPYDTDIRVPALIRGPGIRPGSTMASVVGNVRALHRAIVLSLAACRMQD
jgi:hypothetical protein